MEKGLEHSVRSGLYYILILTVYIYMKYIYIYEIYIYIYIYETPIISKQDVIIIVL